MRASVQLRCAAGNATLGHFVPRTRDAKDFFHVGQRPPVGDKLALKSAASFAFLAIPAYSYSPQLAFGNPTGTRPNLQLRCARDLKKI